MKLLSFGAILWDVIEGQEYIGGAPFNLAAHAAILGLESHLVSAVGNDERGRRALMRVKKLGVRDDLVRIVDAPTGVVDVWLDPGGSPAFTIRQPAAWDYIELSDEDLALIKRMNFDMICFGSLEQRESATKKSLRALLASAAEDGGPQRFCDINLRAPFYDAERVEYSIRNCEILKLNGDEAREICGLLSLPFNGLEDFCRMISGDYGTETVCVTLGDEGCLVYDGEETTRCPGVKVKVVDTVGAGDAFSAAFIARLLNGAKAAEAGEFACRMGALVASKTGAIPDYDPSEL